MSTSASSSARWVACPASEALPKARAIAGAAAQRGILVHRFLARAAESGRDIALKELSQAVAVVMPREGVEIPVPGFEVYAFCAALDLSVLPVDPGAYSSELWLAWNPRLARGGKQPTWSGSVDELVAWCGTTGFPQAVGKLDREGWCFGAADVAAIDGQRGFIADFKTGEGFADAPRDSAQIRCLAMLLATRYGLTEVDAQVIRLVRDGEIVTLRATFTESDFEAERKTITAALRRVARARSEFLRGGTPTVYQGDHCRYCPAYNSCPAKVGLIRVLASDPEAIIAELRNCLVSAEMVGVAHMKLKPLEDLLARMREETKAAAKQFGNAPLPDGRFYGPVEVTKRDIDSEKAFDALSVKYGPRFALSAMGVITWSGIDRTVSSYRDMKFDEPAPKKALMQEVEAALDEAGAIVRRVETQVREHK